LGNDLVAEKGGGTMTAWQELYHQPLLAVTLTVCFYMVAQQLHQHWKWLHPLIVTTGGLIAFLLLTKIPYESYKVGGDMITFFLGPATISLAVPLYKYAKQIKGRVIAIVTGVTVGSLAGLISVGLTIYFLHGTQDTFFSMLPKSVTAPIAIEISRQLGGTPELTGVFTALTGLFGSMMSSKLLRCFGIRSDWAIGTAMGTAAHGIGTAKILRESEFQGGISSLAMGLSSFITPVLCIPISWWVS
jgi:predicted murein hydrolase (TIGR00659 family)